MPLIFNPSIAKSKPTNSDKCPFCDIDHLDKLLEKKDEFIWLENKYRTLENSFQTIIIESNDHFGDISNYSYEYNRELFSFALSKLFELLNSCKYKSVAMFKNFGELSGGSLRHPHLQIVGFENEDIYAEIKEQNFIGMEVPLGSDNLSKINISLEPIMGFCEFNITTHKGSYLGDFSDNIKDVVMYLVNDYFSGKCNSYNIFFYVIKEQIICKIIPRFVVSPYFVGYRMAQINNFTRLSEIKEEFLIMKGKKNEK
ncbi:TPA: DUF4931 domain-containing protein [Streptococcus mutans]